MGTLTLQLQLLTIFVVSLASAEQYYIVPNNSTTVHYQKGTFLTLEELSSKIRIHEGDKITLNFLPGNHSLRQRLTINGITHVSLIGLDYNSRMTIKCFGSGGLDFQHIQNLRIESLEFSGCGHTAGQMKGGAITIREVEEVLIRGCHFVRNQIIGMNAYGGALYMENTVLATIYDSSFTSNFAQCGGGAMYATQTSRIVINSSHFEMNNGFAEMYSKGTEVETSSTTKIGVPNNFCPNNFLQTSQGGAIFVEGGTFSISESEFINNQADRGGAIFAQNCSITTSGTTNFTNNRVDGAGGAIYSDGGSLQNTDTHYINNVADFGGAIYAYGGSVKNIDCQFNNNNGSLGAGAINCAACSIVSVDTNYTDNSAGLSGGVIHAWHGFIVTANDHYTNNTAIMPGGGAIHVENTSLCSTNCHYTHNVANEIGGAIYALDSMINITGNHFSYNAAATAAAIFQEKGHLNIFGSSFTNNQVDEHGDGIVYASNTVLVCSGHFNFLNNTGSLYAFNSQVHIEDVANFSNNAGQSGGAITSSQSIITFNKQSTVTITGNKATYGGGLALTESTLNIFGATEIKKNSASLSGGGIYAYQSQILFRVEQNTSIITISSNTASGRGGGVHAIASSIRISYVFLYLQKNTATMYGGALFLEHNSKIYVNKLSVEDYNDRKVQLMFRSNLAQKGGAIYIADNTNIENLCDSTTNIYTDIISKTEQNSALTECFLQTLRLYTADFFDDSSINTVFINNTASHSGGDIYGGLLDRCTMNPLAEIQAACLEHTKACQDHTKFPLYGLAYLLATVQFDSLHIHRSSPYDFEDTQNDTLQLRNKNRISSDVVQVCFCLDNVINCTYNHPTVFTRKGETFMLSVIAVDQVGGPANATVITSFSSEQGIGRLREGQDRQLTENQCTTLEYNVYSTASMAQIQLHANGPCNNLGMSKRDLNISFLSCICPFGFQQALSPINCICECDQRLKPYLTGCAPENGTILVETNVWIEYINTTNATGYVIERCPFDYCVEKPVNISLNSDDQQCNYNRTGSLCGKCKEGLSLVFASSQCLVCTDYYIFLLIPFALAGIALIGFILILNMTVATGTIHGLIFYANILTANRSIFLPFKAPNILTVFISWLNLDLGIETCFYDGMDSYGKVLLQIVFPTYLFLLIGTIIVLCEYSKRLSVLFGKRNPVAVLGTAILLSYSKLLRTIIAALQNTHLDYPDGSREIVWLYDANVPYFTASHIPRLIAAIIIITVGAVYTILLFFGQWFHNCSNRKFMEWVRNPKYNSFIDAFHAPFSPKHRYWVGLLLLVRIIHYLVSAFTSDSDTILSVCIIVFGLVILKFLNSRIYKNWALDTLETSFLMNLGVLSVGTLYLRPNGNQIALANTSMAISFLTFLGILCYNVYRCILKGTGVWLKLTLQLRRHNQRPVYQPVPLDDDMPLLNLQPEMEPEQVYTDDGTITNDPPSIFDPPVIRSCVPMDQLREPALDELSPVRADDYNKPAVSQEHTVVTFSVVDIGRSNCEVN